MLAFLLEQAAYLYICCQSLLPRPPPIELTWYSCGISGNCLRINEDMAISGRPPDTDCPCCRRSRWSAMKNALTTSTSCRHPVTSVRGPASGWLKIVRPVRNCSAPCPDSNRGIEYVFKLNGAETEECEPFSDLLHPIASLRAAYWSPCTRVLESSSLSLCCAMCFDHP